nr:proline-rich protein 36-like [Odocoileus virginianus texanus]
MVRGLEPQEEGACRVELSATGTFTRCKTPPLAGSSPPAPGRFYLRSPLWGEPQGPLQTVSSPPREPVSPSTSPEALAATGTSVTGLLPHTPEPSPEVTSPTSGPGAPTAEGTPTVREMLAAATGTSAVCLLPDKPEKCPESISSPTGPGIPMAVCSPMVTHAPPDCLPPAKPEMPPGPISSLMGPGTLAVVGIPILMGSMASIGPHTVSLSPHKPETPTEQATSCTGQGALRATGTPTSADTPAVRETPAVCLPPGKCKNPPEPVSTPRGAHTRGAQGTSAGMGTLALCLLPHEPASSPANPSSWGAVDHLLCQSPRHLCCPLSPPRIRSPPTAELSRHSSGYLHSLRPPRGPGHPQSRRRFGSLSALTQRVSRTKDLARRLVPRPRNISAPHLFPHGRRTPRPYRLGPTHRPSLSATSSRTPGPGKAPWPAAPLIASG